MKGNIALALFALFSTAAMETGSKAKAFIECSKKHNINMSQVKASFVNKKLPETENGKCFLECMMSKAGIIEDGKFMAEKTKEINARKMYKDSALREKADKIIDMCSKEVEIPEAKCELGVSIARCGMKHAKEMGVPPPILDDF